MSQIPAIVIDKAILGGIADSPYMGKKDSLASIVGFNLHKVPGLMLVNQALQQHSPVPGPTAVDDLVKIVQCSDGKKRLFGKTTGKLWEIDANGVYTQPAVIPIISDPQYPTAAVNDNTTGTVDWVNPANVLLEDGSTATFTSDAMGEVSHYLKTTGYNFDIPTGAVITGIIVEVKKYLSENAAMNPWSAAFLPISLVKGGTITGTTTSGSDIFDVTNAYKSKGGTQDLWGISLTPTDVNASNFGVAIAVSGVGSIANIDTVRVRVCYTLNGGGAGIFDAMEYYGYVYYATEKYLGQYKVGDPMTTRIDDYGAFLNADYLYHPMLEQNLVLYIGDGNAVAQVDSSGLPYAPTAFSQTALKIVQEERVSALGTIGTNLLVGSKSINNLNKCRVYNWNTYSQSFDQSDVIPENGVNSFIPDKLRTIINAGENGNFYEYVKSYYGLYLQPLEQIPPDFPQLYNPSNTGLIHHTAVDFLQQIAIFGFSRTAGNPAKQGLYTLGARDTTFPTVLTLEYPVSTNSLYNLTIWSIAVIGNDIYVSYKDETDPQNIIYRVDKLDWNKKATLCYFETMIAKYTKTLMDKFKEYVVGYDQLPEGTTIDFYYNKNKAGYVKFNSPESPDEFIDDSDRKIYKGTQQIQARTIQFKVVINTNNNDAPNIEDATVLME